MVIGISRFLLPIDKICFGSAIAIRFRFKTEQLIRPATFQRNSSSPFHALSSKIMSRFDQKGLFVATFTPMKDNGDINPAFVPVYVQHLVRHKIPGIFVNGTAGEGLSMTVDERKTMAEAWTKEAKKANLKCIIHCGALSLRDAAAMASHAEQIGADAIAAVPSFYFSPRAIEGLVDGLAVLAAAAPKTPFLYYHIPRMTNVDLDMSTFLREAKAKIPTLSGMKYSGFDLAGALKCLSEHGSEFEIMWGRDDVLLGALAVGMKSFIGSTYNFTAPLANRIIGAYEAGDIETARSEQLKLKRIMDLTEKHGEQVATFKALTGMLELNLGPTRAPLRAIDTESFKKSLMQLGYFDWIKP